MWERACSGRRSDEEGGTSEAFFAFGVPLSRASPHTWGRGVNSIDIGFLLIIFLTMD
jgi:hypothetical protein